MARGMQPFEAVHMGAPSSSASRSKGRVVAAFLLAGAMAAVCAVAIARGSGSTELGMGSDEVMKGWTKGMFPPDAKFPAGYHFGNDNVFGKRSVFGAGDTFGRDNVFGKNNHFGAGSHFGDNNNFGAGTQIGQGSELGNREMVGRGSSFESGSIIGSSSLFGRKSHFGKRVVIGRKNVFGRASEFGRRETIGAYNEWGPKQIFGMSDSIGKNAEFGSDEVFNPDTNLHGRDEFGTHDWGISEEKLPDSDKASWAAAQEVGWKPEVDSIGKSYSLKQLATSRLAQKKGGDDTQVLKAIQAANGEAKDVGERLLRITKSLQTSK
mmetsp:Transcript_38677/g.88194  ORF Transcript_38677/g.88194 Transcript_38677/m.88194 type:complete len:322 (+) Transcript_38677:2-967(+)